MSPRQIDIQWIDIHEEEPTQEVLAIGYQEEMMIGYVYKSQGSFIVESEGSTLTFVTHWIPLSELRSLRRLQMV